MKFNAILIALLCFISSNVNAQTKENTKITVTGTVLDSLTKKNVEYPTVALFTDSLKLIKAVAGGADGRFYIEAPSRGKFILSVSMLGYSTLKMDITIDNTTQKTFNAGNLYITEGLKLSAVTVTGVRPLIKNEPDKLTYNVDSDPQASSSAIVDILRKVPMLSVDADETVRLNGETNFKVLVNGRSSGILVKNFKQAIKAMPANSVKSIEVITNPPVKYDAEGAGGVINIITNRSTTEGYSVSLNSSINTLGGINTGAYISAQKGKLAGTININSGYNPANKRTNHGESENFISDEFRYTNSESSADSKSRFSNLSVDLSYDIDSLNLITLSGMGYLGSMRNNGIAHTRSFNISDNMTRAYSNDYFTENLYGTWSSSLSYQKSYKKPNKNLTISYNLDAGPDNSESESKIENELNYIDYHQHSKNIAHGLDHTLQVDFYDPISAKHNIETGAKYILRTNISNSTIELMNEESGEWEEQPEKIHDLDYSQHIISLYGGYNYKQKSISARVGLRAEYTINDGLSKNYDGDISFLSRQFDVVPYISLSYRLTKGRTLTLGYTQRLNRPSIYYLNPYVDDSNPMYISYGNPELNSVKRHAINLNYRKVSQRWNYGFTLTTDFTNNDITNIANVNSEGVYYATYENIGKKRSARLNFDYQYRLGQNFGTYMYASVAYVDVSAKEINLSNSGWDYNAMGGMSIGLWKNAWTSADANLMSGNHTLQSQFSVYYTTSFSLNQRLFKNNLTLSVNVKNPFSEKLTYKYDSQGTTFINHAESSAIQRAAGFSLNWRFGKFNANVKRARKSTVDDKMSGGNQSAGK
jgi:hypothetical protein